MGGEPVVGAGRRGWVEKQAALEVSHATITTWGSMGIGQRIPAPYLNPAMTSTSSTSLICCGCIGVPTLLLVVLLRLYWGPNPLISIMVQVLKPGRTKNKRTRETASSLLHQKRLRSASEPTRERYNF